MDWITGIQRAIDYIEENITEQIDYEEAARKSYSSCFHFQRVFSILCGYTLGDYIRMRRLSLAGAELASKDVKVIDIALKYGYDTPESFSRAFMRFHGITPSNAKNGENIKSFSRLSVKLILDGGNIMDYRIETKESFQILCRKKQVVRQNEPPTKEISEFWRQCRADGTIQELCKYNTKGNMFGNSIVGISFSRDLTDEEFPYGIGVAYNGETVTEDSLAVETIPSYTYAVFKCVGPMPEAFQETYKKMYTEFFPASEYQPCMGVEFEVYPSDDVRNSSYTCEIWVAVEKR